MLNAKMRPAGQPGQRRRAGCREDGLTVSKARREGGSRSQRRLEAKRGTEWLWTTKKGQGSEQEADGVYVLATNRQVWV